MQENPYMHDQRNRLYRTVRGQGSLSAGRLLEESRKLDALVMRYYRALSVDMAGMEPETEVRDLDNTEMDLGLS